MCRPPERREAGIAYEEGKTYVDDVTGASFYAQQDTQAASVNLADQLLRDAEGER